MTIEERIRHHSQGAAKALADSLRQRKIDRLLAEAPKPRAGVPAPREGD